MNNLTEDARLQLSMSFFTTWVTVVLASISGQITLLTTVYDESDFQWISHISILLFMGALIFLMGATEALKNRVGSSPNFKSKTCQILHRFSPKTIETEYMLSYISAICIALAIIILGLFLWIES